jgi:hypothetical protein
MHRTLALSLLLLTGAPFAAPAAEAPEPRVQQIVMEDDHTRVEELRVRGQAQKVTVQNKNSKLPGYEIVVGDGGRDLSPNASSPRGAAGQRVWRLLDF